MAISPVDAISPAFERMKQCLFKPVRLGQWFRFAITGLLAGEMGSAAGCNPIFNIPSRPREEFQGGVIGGLPVVLGVFLILGLVALGVILGIILLYVSSRMRFVLLDSIISRECRIGEFWRRRREPAFRYFVFQFLLALTSMTGIAILVGIPLLVAFSMGWFVNPRANLVPLILSGLIVGLVVLIFVFFIAIVTVLTKDFVAPQMAIENVTAFEGWRRLWIMMKQTPGSYAGYIGLKLVLAIAASIITGMAIALVVLALLLPVGGFGVVTVILARAAGMTWNPITIAIAIVAGIIVLVGLLVLFALIAVPTIVFFPAYSIHFFADRHPPLRDALAAGS